MRVSEERRVGNTPAPFLLTLFTCSNRALLNNLQEDCLNHNAAVQTQLCLYMALL